MNEIQNDDEMLIQSLVNIDQLLTSISSKLLVASRGQMFSYVNF